MTARRHSGLLGNRILHTRLAALVLLCPLALTGPRWIAGSTVHEGLEWIGYAAVIACVLGRTWCTLYIGGRKKHEIVACGPYSVVRNPLYVFSFVGLVGLGLFTASLTWTLILAAAFMLYYRVVVRREEAFLLAAFPVEYRRYLERTPRWVPNPGLWRDTASVTLRPGLLLRAMADSAWFVAAFPAFEALDRLHAAGILPVLLPLP